MLSDAALEKVAEQYELEGYEVLIRPGDEQLPPFATGLRASLLAKRHQESVLVNVRETTDELRNDPDSMTLADAVATHPGWRFDLVVLNEQPPSVRRIRDLPEPDVDEVLRNLSQAELSASGGDAASSLVIAWGALESVMRRAVRAADLKLANVSPAFLLRTLYAHGFLELADFQRLSESLRVRNAVVHGLARPQVDASLPLSVAKTARRLLSGVDRVEVAS